LGLFARSALLFVSLPATLQRGQYIPLRRLREHNRRRP